MSQDQRRVVIRARSIDWHHLEDPHQIRCILLPALAQIFAVGSMMLFLEEVEGMTARIASRVEGMSHSWRLWIGPEGGVWVEKQTVSWNRDIHLEKVQDLCGHVSVKKSYCSWGSVIRFHVALLLL